MEEVYELREWHDQSSDSESLRQFVLHKLVLSRCPKCSRMSG